MSLLYKIASELIIFKENVFIYSILEVREAHKTIGDHRFLISPRHNKAIIIINTF